MTVEKAKSEENIYKVFKRQVDEYIRAREDYKLYRDFHKLREMVKKYHETIIKMGRQEG